MLISAFQLEQVIRQLSLVKDCIYRDEDLYCDLKDLSIIWYSCNKIQHFKCPEAFKLIGKMIEES